MYRGTFKDSRTMEMEDFEKTVADEAPGRPTAFSLPPLSTELSRAWAPNTTWNFTLNDTVSLPEEDGGITSTVMDVVVTITVCLILVAMGCTLDLQAMLKYIKRPYGIAVGVMSQFVIMPLVAFLLCLAFQLEPARALSVLVVGTCPGGHMSNLLVYWLDGDINLSICMTTVSTALAMGLMPLCLWIYSKPFTTATTVVPYGKIVIALVTIIIPVSVGIFLKYKSPKGARLFLKIGGIFGIVIILASAVLGGIAYKDMWTGPPAIFLIAFVFPTIGYSFGYVIAWLFRMEDTLRKTVCIETGTQNIGIALSILKLTFAPELASKIILFPMLYATFQGTEAMILVVSYQIWKRKCKAVEEKEEKETADEAKQETLLDDAMTKDEDVYEFVTAL
ncbi:PREDICTED: ileal sodium/bile acid cotransporter-like [Branchiostoma belcheri]|uniref:Ileal sodium/bile acid cotransporter-like n=1 Tax=Branchiostoma belcheri TaxID=7741 RepID=A0A6P4ZZM2_BRABE|nr:PREDICTED: ileal sodium/bile acid cotransporter-like [Branchiostoma belcheri]